MYFLILSLSFSYLSFFVSVYMLIPGSATNFMHLQKVFTAFL